MLVFSTPYGLPTSRVCNHKIPLMLDSSPIKVKPYWYLHSQKPEIKKMVHQMLADGLIEHCTSPFFSPVVLIKKKKMALGVLVSLHWLLCFEYNNN